MGICPICRARSAADEDMQWQCARCGYEPGAEDEDMLTVIAAIRRHLPGPANVGLRAYLKALVTRRADPSEPALPERIRLASGRFALTPLGKSAFEAIATAAEAAENESK